MVPKLPFLAEGNIAVCIRPNLNYVDFEADLPNDGERDPQSHHALIRSSAISPAFTLMTLNKVSPSPWVDSVQPWMCILGSNSMPASLGTSRYLLVTYTFEGGSSEVPSSIGEDDPGEVGGVFTPLEVEVGLSVMSSASTPKSDGNNVFESLSCA